MVKYTMKAREWRAKLLASPIVSTPSHQSFSSSRPESGSPIAPSAEMQVRANIGGIKPKLSCRRNSSEATTPRARPVKSPSRNELSSGKPVSTSALASTAAPGVVMGPKSTMNSGEWRVKNKSASLGVRVTRWEGEHRVCNVCGHAGFKELLTICSRCNVRILHSYCGYLYCGEVLPSPRQAIDKPDLEQLCDACRKISKLGNKHIAIRSRPFFPLQRASPTGTPSHQRFPSSGPENEAQIALSAEVQVRATIGVNPTATRALAPGEVSRESSSKAKTRATPVRFPSRNKLCSSKPSSTAGVTLSQPRRPRIEQLSQVASNNRNAEMQMRANIGVKPTIIRGVAPGKFWRENCSKPTTRATSLVKFLSRNEFKSSGKPVYVIPAGHTLSQPRRPGVDRLSRVARKKSNASNSCVLFDTFSLPSSESSAVVKRIKEDISKGVTLNSSFGGDEEGRGPIAGCQTGASAAHVNPDDLSVVPESRSSSWTGSFELFSGGVSWILYEGIQAYTSSSAASKARASVKTLAPTLRLNLRAVKLPSRGEKENFPTEKHIELFFCPRPSVPGMQYSCESEYMRLLKHMLENDLFLKGSEVGGAEIHIFYSHLLPVGWHSWKGKSFLLGVFRRTAADTTCVDESGPGVRYGGEPRGERARRGSRELDGGREEERGKRSGKGVQGEGDGTEARDRRTGRDCAKGTEPLRSFLTARDRRTRIDCPIRNVTSEKTRETATRTDRGKGEH